VLHYITQNLTALCFNGISNYMYWAITTLSRGHCTVKCSLLNNSY